MFVNADMSSLQFCLFSAELIHLQNKSWCLRPLFGSVSTTQIGDSVSFHTYKISRRAHITFMVWFSSLQTLSQSVELLWQSGDCIQDLLFVLLLQSSFTSLSEFIGVPQRLLLSKRFTKCRYVLSVHTVQHDLDHLLDRTSRSRPGDVTEAQLRAACRGTTLKGRRAPLIVLPLLATPSLLLFASCTSQIFLVLLLQPFVQFLAASLFFLHLSFTLASFPPRRWGRESLGLGVFFIIVFLPDAISPVPKVFLIIINRKKVISCETNTAALSSSRERESNSDSSVTFRIYHHILQRFHRIHPRIRQTASPGIPSQGLLHVDGSCFLQPAINVREACKYHWRRVEINLRWIIQHSRAELSLLQPNS